jgi:hypothetical protein
MKRDLTGRAVDLAAARINQVIARINTIATMGPSGVTMSEKELAQLLREQRGENIAKAGKVLGKTDDELMEIIRGTQK